MDRRKRPRTLGGGMKNCKKVLKEARKKILEESVLGRWKEQFEEMKKMRERRTGGEIRSVKRK